MRIRIAHSPDSDDAFMFYGLVSGLVRSNPFEIEHVLSDIETLNRAAFEGAYEITAVSFHAYAHLTDRYVLLPHGASMGDHCGPVVVAKKDGPTSLSGIRVAVLGELTTACLTFRLCEPTIEYLVAVEYAMQFDRDLDRARPGRFVGMYVNDLTLDYGDRSREAVRRLLGDAQAARLLAKPGRVEFAA